MKIFISYLLKPFNNLLPIFFFIGFIFIFSLIFNTSFHIMGVDISQEMENLINQEYVFLILKTNLKILLVYFLFLTPISFLINFIFEKRKFTNYLIPILLFSILIINWFHSIIQYPQVYGEFFYFRHPYLKKI